MQSDTENYGLNMQKDAFIQSDVIGYSNHFQKWWQLIPMGTTSVFNEPLTRNHAEA